jgi:hypothetical protein
MLRAVMSVTAANRSVAAVRVPNHKLRAGRLVFYTTKAVAWTYTPSVS